MKPSIEEVLQKLIELSKMNTFKSKWVYTFDIIESLHEHMDNVLPILLLLEKDKCLIFRNGEREAVTLLKTEMAA